MPCHACTCMHEKCLGVTSHAHTPKNMSPKSGSSTHADAQATFRHLRFINASVCDRQALGQGGVDSEVQVQLCLDKKQPLLHKATRTTFENHVAVANCSFGSTWNGQPQKNLERCSAKCATVVGVRCMSSTLSGMSSCVYILEEICFLCVWILYHAMFDTMFTSAAQRIPFCSTFTSTALMSDFAGIPFHHASS